MVNLIGEQIYQTPKLVELGWSVHDYGKTLVHKGRKMGHATFVGSLDFAVETAVEVGLIEQ